MKKIFLVLLFMLILVSVVYLYFSFSSREKDSSFEERFYLAPSVFLSTPNVENNYGVSLSTKSYSHYINGKLHQKIVPSWTLTQDKNEYTNYVLAFFIVVPSGTDKPDESMGVTIEAIGETAGYQVYSESLVKENGEVLSQKFVAEKILEGRPDLSIKVEALYKPTQKYETKEGVLSFLDDILLGLNYDSVFLATAADNYAKLDGHSKISPADLDDYENELMRESDDKLMEAIYYSMLSEQSLDFVAKEVLKQQESLDGFCDNFSDSLREEHIIPDSFVCVAKSEKLLFSISIDDEISYCSDSSGFNGLVKEGSLGKSGSCK